jgi:hypothetical protein
MMATAPAPQVDLSKVAETYIKIRDAKAEKKRAFEAEVAVLDGQLEKLEGFMLQHLNTHGMDSVRTAGGTFYRQEDIRPTSSTTCCSTAGSRTTTRSTRSSAG